MTNPELTTELIPRYYMNFLIWELTTVLTCLTAYLSFQPIKCSKRLVPLLDRCCVLQGDIFETKHAYFTDANKRVNLRFMMLYSIAIFFLGNKYNQIDPLTEPLTLLYCLVPPASAVLMSYIGNVKGLQTSCSKHSIPTWPIQSWIMYTLVVLITVPLYIYNVYLIYVEEGYKVFICYVTLIVAIFLFELTLYKLWDKSRNIHLHHLFIGTIGSTLFRSNSPYVIPVSMILYGVGVEGASNYGFPDIFEG